MLVERQGERMRVGAAWRGRTVVCIASGPSLEAGQLEQIRAARASDAVRVIVTNDVYLVAPWADLCYFADASWYKKHAEGLARAWPWGAFSAAAVRAAHAAFAGQWVSIEHYDAIREGRVALLQNAGPEGLSADPGAIFTGSNSGYQALQLAALAAPAEILLVAYDLRYHGARTHSHEGHARKLPEGRYHDYAERIDRLAAPLAARGVRVTNCTPGSRLRAFPSGRLDEALGQRQAA